VTPISIAKCARTQRTAAVMPVRRIESGRAECDEVAGFTEYLARNQGQDGIAAKLSVTSPNFYVHRIERISIPQSLTDGPSSPRE
jgi:hypothetical protein